LAGKEGTFRRFSCLNNRTDTEVGQNLKIGAIFYIRVAKKKAYFNSFGPKCPINTIVIL